MLAGSILLFFGAKVEFFGMTSKKTANLFYFCSGFRAGEPCGRRSPCAEWGRMMYHVTNETMKKYVKELTVAAVDFPGERYVLLKLTDDAALPEMRPGQFVNVRVDGSAATFLRRPISINYVDRARNELWLLVQMVGEGTRQLGRLGVGDRLDVLFPLGNGFSGVRTAGERVLLVGGGVGVAPLLYYGEWLRARGAVPTFLLGARSAADLMELDEFGRRGGVCVTTEDGSAGERGFVTQHSVLQATRFDRIAVCGPKPMMVAVAKYAAASLTPCEVSLENMMACGLGACLCCVERTVRGNVCVCTEGPVFDTRDLTWEL